LLTQLTFIHPTHICDSVSEQQFCR